MTTEVSIYAGGSVAVFVSPISRPSGVVGELTRIEPGAHGKCIVHAGQDLLISEGEGGLQPVRFKSKSVAIAADDDGVDLKEKEA